MKLIYFETSALNHLIKNISHESLLGTKNHQNSKGVELIISPVTIWEMLLTKDEDLADKFIFYAQQIFSNNLLASPSEIIVRYLTSAYPENKNNYNTYSNSGLAKAWKKLVDDTTKNFIYDYDEIHGSAKYIREISKNINYLVKNGTTNNKSEVLAGLKKTIDTYYDVMKDDGFFDEKVAKNGFDEKIYHKIAILFVLLVIVLRSDIVRETDLKEFWRTSSIDENNPSDQLQYIFEKYGQIFYIGPIAEMTIMAYHQVHLDKPNRGLIFDCYHMLYAPYVNHILTADKGFYELADNIDHYNGRILYFPNMGLHEILYVSKV